MTTDAAYEDKLEEAYWKFDSTKNSGISERDRFKNLIRAEFPAEPQEKMFHVVRCFSSYSGCEGWSTSEQIVATIKTSKNINIDILTALKDGEDVNNFFGCTPQEFNDACRVSPFKSVLAAKLRLISEINADEEWSYFDFWHKLLDGDFSEISNGCTARLYFNEATSEHITKNDTGELVAAYTSIFFKEAAQFHFFNNEEIDSIEFEISW